MQFNLTCNNIRENTNKVQCVKMIRQLTGESLYNAKQMTDKAELGATVRVDVVCNMYNPDGITPMTNGQIISAINATGYHAELIGNKLIDILLEAVQEAIRTEKFTVASNLLMQVNIIKGEQK